MPKPTIYTFLPPVLNKPVLGLLETGQHIRTSKIVIIEESRVVRTILGEERGYFITTERGSHHTLIVLPVSALQVWLADLLGISSKEALTT
jgi:hypothetical protein